MTEPFFGLFPQHQEKLVPISPEVADARGYKSAKEPRDMNVFGFKGQQRCAPSLIIPVCSVETGKVIMYQSRPDAPRLNDKGDKVKYELPFGSRMALDANPLIVGQLRTPRSLCSSPKES